MMVCIPATAAPAKIYSLSSALFMIYLDANRDYLQDLIRRRLRIRIQESWASKRLDRMMYGSLV